jgi:hypothetical protein
MQKKQSRFIHYLPVLGCIATGIIYVAVGVIAVLSFFKIKNGGADENSLFAFLDKFIWGKFLVVIILLGTLSYIIWRFYEAVTDPYEYGSDYKGLAKRIGIALSTVADMLIAYAAIGILLGIDSTNENGQPNQLRDMVGNLMDSWGIWLVIAIGLTVAVTAVVQFIYGITRGYKERLELEEYSRFEKRSVYILGWIGYFSRGTILGIIAYSFINAGIQNNSQLVVNTDKAFNFIGENIGTLGFNLIAIGTVCYGIFMFALGISCDIDRD